jgi:putative hydrolase of the HAD superfamily
MLRGGKENVCVVFDLDDTLYLERDYVRSGFDAVGAWCAERLGIRGVKEQAQALFDQGKRGDIFDGVLVRHGLLPDADTVAKMVKVYREHAPTIQLSADAVECLNRLRGRVHLGLLTDGTSEAQWAKIDALGLRGRFDTIVVTGDWGTEFFKPHVRGYLHLESKAQACRGRFVYVADNPAKDFTAPRALAWDAVRVRRPGGLHEHELCLPELARCEVSNLESVPALISMFYTIEV